MNITSSTRKSEDFCPAEPPAKKVCAREESRRILSSEEAQQIVNEMYYLEDEQDVKRLTSCFQANVNRVLQDVKWRDGAATRIHKNRGELSFWLRQSGHKISMTFIQDLLSQGSFKKVKEAVGVCISETIEFNRKVLYRVKQAEVEEVKRGLKMHREIFSLIDDASRYFVPPPIIYPIYRGKKGREKLEFEAPRCAGTLFDVIKNTPFQTEEGDRFLTSLEIILGLKNVALGVEKLIAINRSHQDLKSNNILVDLSNGSLSFLISDFDLIVKEIPGEVSEDDREGYFLNFAARQGLATKETDCYSLALLIAESLIFDFENSFHGDKRDNEGRLEAYRNLANDAPNFSKNYREEFRMQQLNSLKALFPAANLSLLFPFENIEENPSHKDQRDLLNFGAILKSSGEECDFKIACHIEQFVVSTVLENRVLGFLGKFLDADLKIEESLDEGSESESSLADSDNHFQSSMMKQFERNPFPTIGEIKQLLDDCESEIRQLHRM